MRWHGGAAPRPRDLVIELQVLKDKTPHRSLGRSFWLLTGALSPHASSSQSQSKHISVLLVHSPLLERSFHFFKLVIFLVVSSFLLLFLARTLDLSTVTCHLSDTQYPAEH